VINFDVLAGALRLGLFRPSGLIPQLLHLERVHVGLADGLGLQVFRGRWFLDRGGWQLIVRWPLGHDRFSLVASADAVGKTEFADLTAPLMVVVVAGCGQVSMADHFPITAFE
jgi:hypothetical protein